VRIHRLVLVLVLASALAACGGDSDEPAEGPAPDKVTGLVVSVESTGLNEVTSFEVKEDEETYEILIDEEINYGFPLGHIEEHRKTAAPVEVELVERDGRLYATSILDAG
jgi:hypothetical protein